MGKLEKLEELEKRGEIKKLGELEKFLIKLHNEFEELEGSFYAILKVKKDLEKDILIEKGFLIKKYSLDYGRVDLSKLDKLISELKRILSFEITLQEQLAGKDVLFKKFEFEYNDVFGKSMHTELLQNELKEVLYHSNLMVTRIEQFESMIEEGLKLRQSSLGENTKIFFASFENVANKILRFIQFLEQITKEVLYFYVIDYFPAPKNYGRAMAVDEFKETISEKKLSSEKDLIPVFDATKDVKKRIKAMTKDERKDFFGQIGVEGAIHVVFFETKIKPINWKTPIKQTNGLREYKFHKGMNIENIEVA